MVRSTKWQKCSDGAVTVNGQSYKAEENGWFTVPLDDALPLLETPFWHTRVSAVSLGLDEPLDDVEADPYPKVTRGAKRTT
jgi:hypothetical protein